MRTWALLVVLAALLAGCTGREGAGSPVTGPQQNNVGGISGGVFPADDRVPAPTLAGTTLDGQHLDVSTLRGRVVVVNFWASWCAPCIAEAPNLNAVHAKTRASGVSFVGIDFKDDRTSARSFERSKKVTYPSLYDPDGRLLLKFRGLAPQSPPTTIILDRQGRIAARFLQAVTESELLAPVQRLAAEDP